LHNRRIEKGPKPYGGKKWKKKKKGKGQLQLQILLNVRRAEKMVKDGLHRSWSYDKKDYFDDFPATADTGKRGAPARARGQKKKREMKKAESVRGGVGGKGKRPEIAQGPKIKLVSRSNQKGGGEKKLGGRNLLWWMWKKKGKKILPVRSVGHMAAETEKKGERNVLTEKKGKFRRKSGERNLCTAHPTGPIVRKAGR